MLPWGSYGLADAQIYTALSYDRLVERCLREAWPAQPLVIAVGLGVLALLWWRPALGARVLAAAAALACAAVALRWMPHCYAELHWISPTLAIGYGAQAVLLAAAALWPRAEWSTPMVTPQRSALMWQRGAQMRQSGALVRQHGALIRHRGALVFATLALLALPLLALPAGASPWRAEWPGLMPGPSLALCLAVVPLAPPRWRWLLLPLPVAGIAFEAVTLASIGRAAWVQGPLLLLLLGVLLAVAQRRDRVAPRT